MTKLSAFKDTRPVGAIEKLGYWWCRHVHNSVMWPVHGFYRCRKCHRQFQVEWDQTRALELQLQPRELRSGWDSDIQMSIGTMVRASRLVIIRPERELLAKH